MLTGGIATGKSAVLDRFAALGVPTLDADAVAHEAYAPGGPAWQQLRDRFGVELFDNRGRLDRRRLGALVFADESALAALNAIVHPHVRTAIAAWFVSLETRPTVRFAIVAIPLFFENPRPDGYDRAIVTACRPDTQRTRVMARGLSDVEARRRIAAQLPTPDKVRLADNAIWTDGTRDETARQADEIYALLSGEDANGRGPTTGDRRQEAADEEP